MQSSSIQSDMIAGLGLINSSSQSKTHNAQKFCKNTTIDSEKSRLMRQLIEVKNDGIKSKIFPSE